MAYTKGPWVVLRDLPNRPGTIHRLHKSKDAVKQWNTTSRDRVADVFPRETQEEQEANANLIATSPDFLEELEALLHGQPDSGTLTITIGWMAHKRLRQLIAKARGEL